MKMMVMLLLMGTPVAPLAGLNVTVGAMLSVPPPVSVPPSVSVPVPGTCIRVIPRAY